MHYVSALLMPVRAPFMIVAVWRETVQRCQRDIRTLTALTALVTDLRLQARCYGSSASTAGRQAEDKHRHLGRLCSQFKRYARDNNADAAARLHAAYLAAGGEPQLWMANMLLGTYARRREASHAWQLFQGLLRQGRLQPDLFTYAAMLNALAKGSHPPYDLPPEAAQRAEEVVAHLQAAGLRPNQVVFHSLMDCQAKAALPDAALRTLHQMQAEGVQPTPQTFNLIITACARAGQAHRALEVVERLMPRTGVTPDTSVWNALLGAQAGSVDAAYATWLRMLDSGAMPDAFTERKLAEAFASHPQLAAEVVAEARQVRRQHEQQMLLRQQQQQQQQQQPTMQGRGQQAGTAVLERAPGQYESAVEEVGRNISLSDVDPGSSGPSQPRMPRMNQPPLVIDRLAPSSGKLLMWEDAEGRQSATAAAGSALQGAAVGQASHAPSPSLQPSGPAAFSSADAKAEAPCQTGAATGVADPSLRRLLWLDLHGMSQAAARMSLLRRLEVLVSVGPELTELMEKQQQQQTEAEAEAAAAGDTERQTEQWEQQPADSSSTSNRAHHLQRSRRRQRPLFEQGLVIITGVGRHSPTNAPAVLRDAVSELLQQQGLPPSPDPSGNAGRMIVPWPALGGFIRQQREAMRTDHFLSAARARYTYVAAGAAGLVAAALIVPRLGPWLG